MVLKSMLLLSTTFFGWIMLTVSDSFWNNASAIILAIGVTIASVATAISTIMNIKHKNKLELLLATMEKVAKGVDGITTELVAKTAIASHGEGMKDQRTLTDAKSASENVGKLKQIEDQALLKQTPPIV